jgi:hypothetical protein
VVAAALKLSESLLAGASAAKAGPSTGTALAPA